MKRGAAGESQSETLLDEQTAAHQQPSSHPFFLQAV